jgi:hypothetical protein
MFSKQNPYWFPLRIAGVFPDYQPRLTGADYAYATTWELNRYWLQGKLCLLVRKIRDLMWKYLTYINFRNAWKSEVRALRARKAGPFSRRIET